MMLRAQSLQKTFLKDQGDSVHALREVSLEVAEGQLFTLLGASGSGKTTLLRSIAGLERPDGGRIEIGGAVVFDGSTATFVASNKRQLGMVFQSYAIWPHMTVFQNAAYPLRTRGNDRRTIRKAVMAALETMQMEHLADRPATMLSGGQQQRLALARAIVASPRLLLLDEPLSNLDAKLRERMRFEIKRLQQELGITTIYVTHDQSEALALSDEIAVMCDGSIVQQGSSVDIYYRPASEYVADFIGSTNLLPGSIAEAGDADAPCVVEVDGVPCRGVLRGTARRGDAAALAIRPEEIQLGTDTGTAGERAENRLTGVVKSMVFLGESTDFLVESAGIDVRIRAPGPQLQTSIGDRVTLTLTRAGCLVFPRDRQAVSQTGDEEPLAAVAGKSAAPVHGSPS